MRAADLYLTENIERGELPRSRAFYAIRSALASKPVRSFLAGLAAGIVATLFAVLLVALITT